MWPYSSPIDRDIGSPGISLPIIYTLNLWSFWYFYPTDTYTYLAILTSPPFCLILSFSFGSSGVWSLVITLQWLPSSPLSIYIIMTFTVPTFAVYMKSSSVINITVSDAPLDYKVKTCLYVEASLFMSRKDSMRAFFKRSCCFLRISHLDIVLSRFMIWVEASYKRALSLSGYLFAIKFDNS